MALFGMRKGDVFSTDKLRKGLENMRKLYGQFGYINFVRSPRSNRSRARTRSISPSPPTKAGSFLSAASILPATRPRAIA